MTKAPDRIWHDGVTQHARELRWEAPTSDLHPQNEYVRADLRPVVKPLEWRKVDGTSCWTANGINARYSAHHLGMVFQVRVTYGELRDPIKVTCGSLDEAKKWAQSMETKTILSALDLAPVTPAQAARELLENTTFAEKQAMKEAGVNAMMPNGWELSDKIAFGKGFVAALRAIAEGGEP